MAVLEQTQFEQLVQEVREAILLDSQGVGDVERVTSLSGIVSLPALFLSGTTEKVVEAPLELLSAPAVEAAADARKATEDATVAAVNAQAAADLANAEREDIEDLKAQSTSATQAAAEQAANAWAGTRNTENAVTYALKMAQYLQTKLEQAQVVIVSGKGAQDVLETMSQQVQDTLLVAVHTQAEALSAVRTLQELSLQVAMVISRAEEQQSVVSDAAAGAQQAAAIAYVRANEAEQAAERCRQTVTESVIQMTDGRLTVIRLEELEKQVQASKAENDMAVTDARNQAARASEAADLATSQAQLANEVTERAIISAQLANDAAERVNESKVAADLAAEQARDKAELAQAATELAQASTSQADIAAARAIDAEQKALDAAKTAQNIVSGIRPDWEENDKTNSNYIANKPEIPTLDAAPTEQTLTYTNKDGNQIAFKIGDEVRVLEDEEYTFYKLYDLSEDGKASWDEAGSGAAIKPYTFLTGADYNASNVIVQGTLFNE